MDENKKIDRSKLTPEQLDRLDNYQAQMTMIRRLKDLGDMTQEVIALLDNQNKEEADTTKQMAALLLDMRDSLISMNEEEKKDSDQPVLDALAKLEKSITAAVAKIDVKPNVTVSAPDVTVSPAPVDLTAIEKLLKTDIPKAFKEALKAVPQPEKDDYAPLLEAWRGISDQLASIDTATRMKPLPGKIAVTNPDGTTIGTPATLSQRYDYADPSVIYVGKASIGTADSSASWTIVKYDLTDTSNASAKVATSTAWTNRTLGTYL